MKTIYEATQDINVFSFPVIGAEFDVSGFSGPRLVLH